MKRNLNFLWALIVIILATNSLSAQKYVLSKQIPLESTVRYGKLTNGLTYYVKKNTKPENRMELRLVVNAGSVCEDEDQKGLAHFCEHMAFNGTKNFPKQELVSFLEKTGVQFGADLNAYTSYDETVYMLQIPTDSEELINKGLLVMEDWAHQVSYDDTEIDKERGVILEEWRLGKGANERIWRKQMPVIFKDSRYAERDVIGDTACILSANFQSFKRFYKEWYRPDLMALVVVGDIDPDKIVNIIKERFSQIPNPASARPRVKYPIPNQKGTLVSVETDKELSWPEVSILFKYPEFDQSTYQGYRQGIVENIFGTMFSNRLTEYSTKPNPPFLFAYAGAGSYMGNTRALNIFSVVSGNDILPAYKTLLLEMSRISQAGFISSELERAKTELMSNMEKSAAEKDKTESRMKADEFKRVFLENEAAPGVEEELNIYKEYFPDITLDEINNLAKKLLTKENNVVLIAGPEKEGFNVPKQAEVLAMFNDSWKKKYDKYADDMPKTPLMAELPKPGVIISEKPLDAVEAKELRLSNGAKVILKKTDFKNDEVMFSAFSYGGLLLNGADKYKKLSGAAGVIGQSGLADYTQNQLSKYLSGKIVSLYPYISKYSEGFSGNSSVNDLETMLQMVNLYFTKPRKDKDAFEAYKSQMISQIQNSEQDPDRAFYDSVSVTLWNYHPSFIPTKVSDINKYNLDELYNVYKSRFANAGDFTFFFVGNFEEAKIKPMIEQYIASLPGTNVNEKWADDGARYSEKGVEKTILAGMEKKSSVRIEYTGKVSADPVTKFYFEALSAALDIRLREVVREDKSGTYGIYAYPMISKLPEGMYRFLFGWGCAVDRVDELTDAFNSVIDEFKSGQINDELIEKVKETNRRDREVNLKKNRYWVNYLSDAYMFNYDLAGLHQFEILNNDISTEILKEYAQKYLKDESRFRFVQNPKE